jgi:hypothetical protein
MRRGRGSPLVELRGFRTPDPLLAKAALRAMACTGVLAQRDHEMRSVRSLGLRGIEGVLPDVWPSIDAGPVLTTPNQPRASGPDLLSANA